LINWKNKKPYYKTVWFFGFMERIRNGRIEISRILDMVVGGQLFPM